VDISRNSFLASYLGVGVRDLLTRGLTLPFHFRTEGFPLVSLASWTTGEAIGTPRRMVVRRWKADWRPIAVQGPQAWPLPPAVPIIAP
jgi:hypothetical protein